MGCEMAGHKILITPQTALFMEWAGFGEFPRKAEPIGTSKGWACKRGKAEWQDIPTYYQSPEAKALRKDRMDAGITIWEACEKIGIKPSTLSGIEHGSLVVSNQCMNQIRLTLGLNATKESGV